MSLQNYKNSTSFDQCPADTTATNANHHNANNAGSQPGDAAGQLDRCAEQPNDRPSDQTSQAVPKPSSLTNLIRAKFKRGKSNHQLKGKKSKEQKSMVRSISIAFNEDAYASQKSNLESISKLYLNESADRSDRPNETGPLRDSSRPNPERSNLARSELNDSNSSTNLNEHPKKTNKLQKLREKLRSKFKLKANSLEDRSATDLDDSLEQPSEERNEEERDGDLTASGRILDLFDSDLDALSCRTKANLKLRPKSEVFQGQQLRRLNKNHRFTTIEVSVSHALLAHTLVFLPLKRANPLFLPAIAVSAQNFQNLGFGKAETYQKRKLIGKGSYALVFKGYSNLFGKVVALKEISLHEDEGCPFTAIRGELSSLSSLDETVRIA